MKYIAYMKKTKDYLAISTIIFSLITIVIAISLYFHNQSKLIPNANKTEGKIIGYEDNTDVDSYYKLPKIRFIVNRKDAIIFTNDKYILSNVKNNKVIVIYNLDNPSEAMIYEGYLIWGIPLSILIIGIMTLGFGLTLQYFSKRNRI